MLGVDSAHIGSLMGHTALDWMASSVSMANVVLHNVFTRKITTAVIVLGGMTMRLIDADALIRELEEWLWSRTDYRTLSRVINEAPTIEAEPVVHCKECRHWGTGYCAETDAVKVCEYAKYMVGGNGYCVYGERRYNGKAESQDQ